MKVGPPSAKILRTTWNHFREKVPGGPEPTRKTGNALKARDVAGLRLAGGRRGNIKINRQTSKAYLSGRFWSLNQSPRHSGKRSLLGFTPPPKKQDRHASMDTSLSRGQRERASFWNIKGIAEDKGEKRDVSFPREPWTCPPASSCGQLFDCFSPSTN